MSTIPSRKDNLLVKKEDNIINFAEQKEVRKGLLPGGPTGPENWLRDIVPGTFFLAKSKVDTGPIPMLNKFLIIEHKTVSSNLVWWTPDGSREISIWVATLEFSRKFNLAETIGWVDLNTEQSEKTDGSVVRPVLDGGLVHDEGAES